MLELKELKKDYLVGSGKVAALKGIDITFRDSEFVAILGPSGCGKTTLLNLIGGLDHATSGDLIIDGISTKRYTDRDWDTYRNHRIGFVFQSYNLIPHQTVLENVELALTIAGLEKNERIRRAREALDKVGLKDQYDKKPNQLSGGQCQRVAIARALVNEPEILLADEPTGALDSVTSIQVMDLLREIAADRLVIMVTHNPELAEKYATRIIRLRDGSVVSDSAPFAPPAPAAETEPTETAKDRKKRKREEKVRHSKLSFWTAFKLSARNLRSKFKRTLLVCLAGSIGIIGVASVLAVSTGVQDYIRRMQDDMLSGNPISVSRNALDLSILLTGTPQSQGDALKQAVEDGWINVDSLIDYLVEFGDDLSSMMIENNLTQEYLDFLSAMPAEYYSAMLSDFGIEIANNLYTDFDMTGQQDEDGQDPVISLSAVKQMYTDMLEQSDYGSFSSFIAYLSDTFAQAPSEADFILSQYDFVTPEESSRIATEANEIMIVVSNETELTDLLLAQLGYYSQEEFFNLMYKAAEDPKYDPSLDKDRFSYEELLGKTFTWYPNDTIYQKNEGPTASLSPFTYSAYADESWEGGIDLTVTAILRPKENISYGCLESGFYYTEALTKTILQDSLTSGIVWYLVENEEDSFNSGSYNAMNFGISYTYDYFFEGQEFADQIGFVGSAENMMPAMGSDSPTFYTLTLGDLGGQELPESVDIYPVNFENKDLVTDYLDLWNSDEDIVVNGITLTPEDRDTINYTDNLSVIIAMVNNMIQIVTTALIAFTSLSLVVSTVMIAIITYVSVIERIKEIGVIRSLGGRKKDISMLFVSESLLIGGVSGLIGLAVTYVIAGIINLIIAASAPGVGAIAILTLPAALIMLAISVGLTLISGLVPASLAAKKDPVEALRSE